MNATDIANALDAIDAKEGIDAISTAITDDIHHRDAIIALAIGPGMPSENADALVKHPTSRESRATLTRILERATWHPDTLDALRIRRIADNLVKEAILRKNAQLCATAAYLHWLIEDTKRAVDEALAALAINEDTNLAMLVMAAIERNIRRH